MSGALDRCISCPVVVECIEQQNQLQFEPETPFWVPDEQQEDAYREANHFERAAIITQLDEIIQEKKLRCYAGALIRVAYPHIYSECRSQLRTVPYGWFRKSIVLPPPTTEE